MVNTKKFVMIALSSLLLAGCDSAKDANKSNFEKAINRAAFGKRTILYGCAIAVGCTPVLYGVFRGFGLNRIT